MTATRNVDVFIKVEALWDDGAGVWSASSDDVVGLAIEADTKAALIKRLRVVIPELLELNHADARQAKPVELIISGRQSFALSG